jgi:hypothetical protein
MNQHDGFECALCGHCVPAADDSREHIIPQAIGGRLKTRRFICARCNSESGQTWDADLARQLNPLSLFFGIVREQGEPPAQQVKTVMGQKLWLGPGGRLDMTRPTISKQPCESGTKLSVSARSMSEARQILEGLRRKHPKLDVEETLKAAKSVWTAPDGPVTFGLSFGGEKSGRSVVKTAAAYAHHCGVDFDTLNNAKRYLREPGAEACFGYYHETDLVVDRPHGLPLHCIALSGDPVSGLLLGYVEYFSFQRMVVCLSDTYSGEPLNCCHAIDPLTGKKLSLSVRMSFSAADIRAIYDYEKTPISAMQKALADVLPTGFRRQAEAEKNRVLRDAAEYAFANCGAKPGDMLTEQHLKKLSGLFVERMMPFLLRRRAVPVPPLRTGTN